MIYNVFEMFVFIALVMRLPKQLPTDAIKPIRYALFAHFCGLFWLQRTAFFGHWGLILWLGWRNRHCSGFEHRWRSCISLPSSYLFCYIWHTRRNFDDCNHWNFLITWSVNHRISSVYFPQSDGPVEVAGKTVKQLLMANLSSNGDLNNNCFVHAILQLGNTSYPDCGISPAEVVFGHPLRDAFSFVNRLERFLNRYIRRTWRETWRAKEDALCLQVAITEPLAKPHALYIHFLERVRVLIQNQKGNHLRKWDKVRTVVEFSKYDQYVILVLESGRLTTRNWRFLRLIPPQTSHDSGPLGIPSYNSDHAFQVLSAPIGNSRPHVSCTETRIGEQGENQLPNGPLPAPFQDLPPNFLVRSSASVNPDHTILKVNIPRNPPRRKFLPTFATPVKLNPPPSAKIRSWLRNMVY